MKDVLRFDNTVGELLFILAFLAFIGYVGVFYIPFKVILPLIISL